MQVYAHIWSDGFVMEECLSCILCLLVFCLFPMVYVMLVSCYTLLLKVETWGRFCIERKMLMCLESCNMFLESWYVKEMKEQVKTMYVSYLRIGKGKRVMRSNRRETWGCLNLPNWLSTLWTISLYCFSLLVYKFALYVMVILEN